ncbi:hypothetical protein ACFL1C_03805 [Pseudomonadota bacterium]
MTEAPHPVGFNRRVDREWLDHTARMVMAGISEDEIHRELSEYLSGVQSVDSDAKRGSREKTITLLKKTWVNPRKELIPLRDDGLKYLATLPEDQKLAIHWCMTAAAYPFWLDVARVMGRLIFLQGDFHSQEVQRRVREQYGQRETAYRSARYVIYSSRQWGALVKNEDTGFYEPVEQIVLSDPEVIAWVIESQLHASSKSKLMLSECMADPALFPFYLSASSSNLIQSSSRLNHEILGLNEIVITFSR